MNLQKLNVTALNEREIREAEGGTNPAPYFWPIWGAWQIASGFMEGMYDGICDAHPEYCE